MIKSLIEKLVSEDFKDIFQPASEEDLKKRPRTYVMSLDVSFEVERVPDETVAEVDDAMTEVASDILDAISSVKSVFDVEVDEINSL